MKTEGFGVWGSKLRSLFDRYKFVLVVILAGVVLLLLPSFGGEKRGGGADAFPLPEPWWVLRWASSRSLI